MQERARFATPWDFLPLLNICWRNAVISLTLIYELYVFVMEEGCCADMQALAALAALTLALWFWNHTCTTRTLSPVSAARVSLTWKHQNKQVSSIALKKALPASRQSRILDAFFQPPCSLFVFLKEMLNECSGLFGPPDYCLFKALAREQDSYLSMTFGAHGAASHQPASDNTDQSAAPHFKAQLWVLAVVVGGDAF